MKTKIQKRIMKKRKGFTLIEMVIVITIIGILSSIAVTKYSKIQENAKKKRAEDSARLEAMKEDYKSKMKQNQF